jgi:hypothetical protein
MLRIKIAGAYLKQKLWAEALCLETKRVLMNCLIDATSVQAIGHERVLSVSVVVANSISLRCEI